MANLIIDAASQRAEEEMIIYECEKSKNKKSKTSMKLCVL